MQLLVRILPEEIEVEAPERSAMRQSLGARSDLSDSELALLLEMAVEPVHRMPITREGMRAFATHFGPAEAKALEEQVYKETDLRAFAERYGPAEALLLLDSLFAVCGVDGVIDPHEIGRLTRAANDLGIDAMLIGALFRKHDVRHAQGDMRFELVGDRYTIGRDTSCDIPLPDPQVAPRHCELVRVGDRWRIVDLGSGRPTVVNGEPVRSAELNPIDRLRVGSFQLTLDNERKTLTVFGTERFSSLSIRHLKRRIGKTTLLDDVSFTAFSGEVIAVVGPSGAGKTTLLTAISGIAPADSGDVIFDGENFHRLLANDPSLVGNVPQDDVVHAELTVEESLFYSGKLRFPKDVRNSAVQVEVDRVLEELGVEHIRSSRIGNAVTRGISGGQRKRVNLGQELLTRSTRVLFLDEPTTGLDPQTAQEIISLIRQLADQGRIVFIVTHDLSPTVLSMVDHLMVLAPGGRLAWYGPPLEAADYFEVELPDEIFGVLPDQSPEDWSEQYRTGLAWKKYVRTREHLLGLDGVEIRKTRVSRGTRGSRWKQYWTLTRRYARVKRRDTANMAVLIGQAPILAIAMGLVFEGPELGAMFMLALSALWFGASSAIRELITERTIWRREARTGLSVTSYLASKVTVLGFVVALQCFILVGMLYLWLDLGCSTYRFTFPALYGVTFLTGMVGLSMGLMMSAFFRTSEAAIGALPLILIPQITFSGLLVRIKHMGLVGKLISYTIFTRYSFDALLKTGTKMDYPRVPGVFEARCVPQMLYEVGFRSSTRAGDWGIPLFQLLAILTGCMIVMLGITAILTRRAARGN